MESSVEIYVSSIIEFLNVSKDKCDGGEPVIGLSDYPDITSVEDRKPFFVSKNGKNEYRLMPGDMELDTSSLRGLLSEIIESSSNLGIGKYVFFIITRIDPTKIVNGLDGENGRLYTTVDVWKFPKDQLSSINEPPTTKEVHTELPPPPSTKDDRIFPHLQKMMGYSPAEPKLNPVQANVPSPPTPIPENYQPTQPLPLPHPKYQPPPSVGPVPQVYYPPTVVQNPSMGSVDVEDLEMIELFGKKIKKTNLVLVIGGLLIGSAIAYYFVYKKKSKKSKMVNDETDTDSNIEKMAKYYKDAYGNNKKTKIPPKSTKSTKYKKGKHRSITKSSKSRKSKR
jgi:hypothetical protein